MKQFGNPPFQLTPLFLSNFFITPLLVKISKIRTPPPNFSGGGEETMCTLIKDTSKNSQAWWFHTWCPTWNLPLLTSVYFLCLFYPKLLFFLPVVKLYITFLNRFAHCKWHSNMLALVISNKCPLSYCEQSYSIETLLENYPTLFF